jgi:hypothetical protein
MFVRKSAGGVQNNLDFSGLCNISFRLDTSPSRPSRREIHQKGDAAGVPGFILHGDSLARHSE